LIRAARVCCFFRSRRPGTSTPMVSHRTAEVAGDANFYFVQIG
jgi:hypothetical protein